jgi:hypothetical protein
LPRLLPYPNCPDGRLARGSEPVTSKHLPAIQYLRGIYGLLCARYDTAMGRHPGFQRSPDDFKPGRIIAWEADDATRRSLADRVRYSGNGAHKTYPSPNGEWIPCRRRGKAACWKFDQHDWLRLVILLRRAIVVGCVAKFENDDDFPSRVWAYINGTLHEARLHNARLGEYHGFPLEYDEQTPIDPNGMLRNAPREQITFH